MSSNFFYPSILGPSTPVVKPKVTLQKLASLQEKLRENEGQLNRVAILRAKYAADHKAAVTEAVMRRLQLRSSVK